MLTGQSPRPLLPRSYLAALLKQSWFLFYFSHFSLCTKQLCQGPLPPILKGGVFSAMSGSAFCSGELGVPDAPIHRHTSGPERGKVLEGTCSGPGSVTRPRAASTVAASSVLRLSLSMLLLGFPSTRGPESPVGVGPGP